MSSKYITCAETAKLVRAALKEKFPAVKFSVRSEVYSGGASITVSYTDGPTTKDVEKVAWRFEGASFDGMIDLKSYHTSTLDGATVHFGADYIFVRRDLSESAVAKVKAKIDKTWGIDWAMNGHFNLGAEQSPNWTYGNDLYWRTCQDMAF